MFYTLVFLNPKIYFQLKVDILLSNYSFYLFRSQGPLDRNFYKIPKDINRFNHWMGQTLPQCLSFAGLVSTMMWLLIHHSDYYKSIHSATMIYIFLISGCIVIIYSWNKKIFKQYLSSNSK